MIHLFNAKTPKNDLITFNGEYILDNICSKGIITEELNGEYSFEGIFRISNSIDKKAYDLLIEDSLLKIDDEYGEEYFRIASIDKTKYEIEVYARHITISDILTMWCEDVRPENQNGNGAINWIFDNAKGVNNFQVSSNISEVSTAYYNNKTVYEALFTADNSFLDRWGGEVYRRGFNIAINSKVGADRGVSIRSRKNLLGFEASTNLNELTTRIYPKGFDGITIEEKYIDSELINNYARVYSREIKFDDVRVNDDYYFEGFETLEQAQEELKRRCAQQFEINKIDIINATYRIDFVELSKTEEYKDYSMVERTWIGDTVNVIEENLDIDINVRVVKRQYDIKKKKRTNTELSNKDTKIKPPTIGDIITEIEKIPSTENILQQTKDQATAIINAGMKNSYVVVRKNEILIMDTEDINTAIKVWRWNNGGLGYSSTGYFGEYGTAITNDGAIVADFITTGVLNANLIKTGIIKAQNGDSFFNLDTGEVNITGTLKSQRGEQFVSLNSGGITFQDWRRKEQMLRLGMSNFEANRDLNGVTFAMPKYSDFLRFSWKDKEDLTDGWANDTVTYNFMDFWSSQQSINDYTYYKGINVYSPIRMRKNTKISLENSSNHTSDLLGNLTWNTMTDLLGICGDNGLFLGYKESESLKARIVLTEGAHPGTGDNIKSWGNWNLSGYTIHNGTFAGNFVNSYSSTLTKTLASTNAVESEEKQIRFLYENIELKEGKAILNIPNRYLSVMNSYAIASIIKKGRGDVWVEEEQENRFIINSENDIKINVEIIIKINTVENIPEVV